jgi:hypothetical protein
MSVDHRLARLERENHLLKWGIMLLVALVLVVILLVLRTPSVVSDTARVVEADRFVVRDRTGAVRVFLGMTDEGDVGMSLLGGADALQPGGTSGALTVHLDPRQAHLRLSLGQDPASAAVVLSAMANDTGRVIVINSDGEVEFTAPESVLR